MFDLVGDGGLEVVDGEGAVFREEVLGGSASGREAECEWRRREAQV